MAILPHELRRAIGSGAQLSHPPPELFRLTCTACEETYTAHGLDARAKWETAHKRTHGKYAGMVFFRRERLN